MTQNPHDTQKDSEKYFLSKNRRKVALKLPKYPLIRDILGDLRATFFVWEMLVLDRRVFCFRGWKSPQGLYNRGKEGLLASRILLSMQAHALPEPAFGVVGVQFHAAVGIAQGLQLGGVFSQQTPFSEQNMQRRTNVQQLMLGYEKSAQSFLA